MAQALFLICMFLITVSGLLLLKPPVPKDSMTEIKSFTEYSSEEAQISRQKLALKMARFLEKNPKIVQQERLTSLPVEATEISMDTTDTANSEIDFQKIIDVQFQGANLQFKSQGEYDRWVLENLKKDPIAFLNEFKNQQDHDLYLQTLKRVSEIDTSEPVQKEVKASYLEEAKKMIQIRNGFEQELTQRALQQYLDLEQDRELGKKTVDELLKKNQ